MIIRAVAAVLAVGCAAALCACASDRPAGTVVTVTRTRAPATATPPATGATSSTSTTPSPDPGSTAPTRLPGACDTLLPHGDVQHEIGRPIPGTDAFVVGRPEPTIGRRAYLNCRYGVTGHGAAALPAIEIGISLYRDASRAAGRIAATVDDYGAHGARASDTTVGEQKATLLTGGMGPGYQDTLLVVADGPRTVAVSLARSFATGATAARDAAKIAALALDRSAG